MTEIGWMRIDKMKTRAFCTQQDRLPYKNGGETQVCREFTKIGAETHLCKPPSLARHTRIAYESLVHLFHECSKMVFVPPLGVSLIYYRECAR